jgi:hypothetical protein
MAATEQNAATERPPDTDPSTAQHAAPGAIAAAVRSEPGFANGVLEWTLPSGKVARMRKGKGKDVIAASRIVGSEMATNPMAIVLAGVAVKTTFDGQYVTYEDLLEFDEEDVWELLGKAQMGKALSPPTISRS